MKTRRFVTVLLTVILAVVLLAVGASAAEIVDSGNCGDNVTWSLDSEGLLTISGSGKMRDYSATNTAGTVTINTPWFGRKVESVVIKDGVTRIGNYAFRDCTKLSSVTISKGVTSIGEEAFSNCVALKSIALPDGITVISDAAFSDCIALTDIILPDELLRIGTGAFSSCYALENITLPASLTHIDGYAFYKCVCLTNIKLSQKLTSIGDHAFDDCRNLTSISLPDSLTKLGEGTFKSCGLLSSVKLSASLESIPASCFLWCNSLESITIPASVTEIGEAAFANCPYLNTITFKGDAPAMGLQSFTDVTATVYYPAGNDSWTEEVMQDYEGELTWVAYDTNQSVKIVEQPKNTYTQKGKTAKVTLKAQGNDLKYQWYIKNAGKTKYSKSSVTSATYSCKMNEKSKDRLVYCIVTDEDGNSVRSKAVILREAASITSQPKDAQTQTGKTIKVSVKASGDNLKYQWYIKNAGKDKFSKSSITSATYSCKMSDKSQGRQVYCVVTDAYGKKAQTKTVTLGMTVSITQQLQSVVVEEGQTAKVSFQAVGDGLKYTWYFSDADDATFKKTSTFTGNTYSVKMSDARNGRLIYCVVSDAYGNKVSTDIVSLKIK
ncbi:MAG: leucine-rich repeat domain-containing protein [Oscillospiraceae bacterium]|nr:leucine-rich repeat domain-containing protein [Oscillospiraceae bacterium]